MAYTKQTWTDRKVEKPLTFLMTTNADGTITLVPYPGVVEQEGTKLSAERFNHMENGIANSVDKNGDTMNGQLNFTNKSDFTAISKTRTLDGTDYCARFGVGIDGSASIEIANTSEILGRLDINKDGKVKNYKTDKYLAEQDSGWHDATVDSTLFSSGFCRYTVLGNMCFIHIGDLKPKADINTHGTVLITGLPKTTEETFITTEISGKVGRLRLANGQISIWYSTLYSSADQYYGDVFAVLK